MSAGIYAIVSKADGRVYVGSSIDIKSRWRGHRERLRSGLAPSQDMNDVWRAHGVEGFEWLILEETAPANDVLRVAEERWIKHYDGRLFNKVSKVSNRRPSRLTEQISITLPTRMVTLLDTIAVQRGVSRGGVIKDILLAGVERDALVRKIAEAVG